MSTTVNVLIFYRIFQGFSAGLIMPLVSNLLVNIAPRDYFQKLMMIVMLPIMIGPVFDPILGAIIVEYGNWQ
nr:MFS transporter [Leuconostoc gelidum]